MKIILSILSAILLIVLLTLAEPSCASSCEKSQTLVASEPKADINFANSLFEACNCISEEKDFVNATKCYDKVNKSCNLMLKKDDSDVAATKLQINVIKGQVDLKTKIGPPQGNRECTCNKNGEFSFILSRYDEEIKKNRSDAEAWNDRGALLGELCCVNESLESFDEAIRYNSSLAEPWYNKGVLLYRTDPAEALKCFNTSVDLKPNLAEAWFNKYGLLMPNNLNMSDPSSKRAYMEAKDSKAKAIDLKPDFAYEHPPDLIFKRIGE
ncbi:TPR repeat protein [uncultured archaeon]|nr:TPR repeat protein [uncultured archaeon]